MPAGGQPPRRPGRGIGPARIPAWRIAGLLGELVDKSIL
jgi:hypothetical protein